MASRLQSISPGSAALIQGASRGLGLELTRQLLEEDALDRVLATCRAPDLDGELGTMARASGGRLVTTANSNTPNTRLTASIHATHAAMKAMLEKMQAPRD